MMNRFAATMKECLVTMLIAAACGNQPVAVGFAP